MPYNIVLIAFLVGFAQCYNPNSYYFENNKYCDDLSPYYGEDINLDQIAGVWYGVEKIPHTKGEYKIEHTRECFYIDIKEVVLEMMFFFVIFVVSCACGANVNYCQDLNAVNDFDEDSLLGMWYIHEYIYHMDNTTVTEYNPYCPIVQIRKFEDFVAGGLINRNLPPPPTPYPPPLTNSPYLNRAFNYHYQEPYRIRHFVLEWHEGMFREDYHVKVNTSHKGFWPTDVPDRSVENQYRFFGGVIQVLKVANNHLVLNFCMRLPNSQLYSVVLSRNENQLIPEDLAHIHNIFTLKHLSTSNLKRVCENSAASLTPSLVFALMWVVVWKCCRGA